MSTTNAFTPNEAQSRILTHGAGPLRIVAGAGSGKTTTLVRRIQSLVGRGLCRPDQILMLTFTTKAVADIRGKVADLLGGGELPRIETYHAFALALVREYADRLGLPADPALLTEAALKLFVRGQIDRLAITRLDLTRIDDVIAKVVDFAGWLRHEGGSRRPAAELLALLTADDDPALIAELLAICDRYREALRAQGALDYDDLIALAVALLEDHGDIAAEITARFPYLLVDEYQDTDHLQGLMVRCLAGAGNITIVGDPDQSIYGFRGAAMTNILDFHAHWPALTHVPMQVNYRSTPEILAAANAVIAPNRRRKDDPLLPHRSPGPRPLLVSAPDWESEARWLAAEALHLHEEGTPYKEIAILVRSNKMKAPLHAALTAAGVPVQVVGGLDLFDDPELLRCIGCIRALADPGDGAALAVALSMPRYGLNDADITALARARARGEGLIDAATRSADERIRLFLAEFWPLYARQFTDGCQAAIRGLLALHAPSLGPAARTGVEQLLDLAAALLARPQLFAGQAGSELGLFAQYLEGLRGAGEAMEAVEIDEAAEAVKLMTVHVAKGLEFPVLFLPRLTERDFAPIGKGWTHLFPLAWHHDGDFRADPEAMVAEEERRLFYVAVTRAQDRLYLSWAPRPHRGKPLGPSPFLAEIAACCDAKEVHRADDPMGPDPGVDLSGLVSFAPAPPLPAVAPVLPELRPPAILSYSHLSTYQDCPYRFFLQYVLRVVERPNTAADEGVRVHAAIERHGKGGAGSLDEVAAWAAVGPVEAGEEAGDWVEAGVGPGPGPGEAGPGAASDPLRAYWESEYARTPPLASEAEFHLRLGESIIRGFIDRIHPLADGAVEVVDFKTYNRLMTEADVKAGLQLPLYIIGARQALGYERVAGGALLFLKHGRVVRVRYTEAELAAARARAEGLAAGIRAGEWGARPGEACRYCGYRTVCPSAPEL